MDLVITEGYKRESRPKIEVFRSAAHKNPLCVGHDDLIAFVSDVDMNLNVPYFGLDEISELADFIEKTFLKDCKAEDGEMTLHEQIKQDLTAAIKDQRW